MGQTIKIGQGADSVQSSIKADRFVVSGYNYGDVSQGYYTDDGKSYIVTFGPPKNGIGGYVVIKIEEIQKQENVKKP